MERECERHFFGRQVNESRFFGEPAFVRGIFALDRKSVRKAEVFALCRFISESRFIGGEVEEVFVNAAVLVDPAIGEAGDVDTALVSLKFKNGAIGVIDSCRKASYGYDQRLEVFGSKAQASAANDTPTHVAFIDENGKVTDKPLYFFLERYMQSFTDEMTEFIDCVLHDKPTKTTVEDGLQALRMGLAAKKSLAEHRPVKLSEIEA